MSHDMFNEHWRNSGSEGSRVVLTGAQTCRYAVCAALLLLFVLWDYKIAFAVLNFAVCAFYIAVISYKVICVLLSVFTRPEAAVLQVIHSEHWGRQEHVVTLSPGRLADLPFSLQVKVLPDLKEDLAGKIRRSSP